MTLLERRARFVYEAARLATIAANAPIIPALWEDREAAFKDQFLGVIVQQCGPHPSWSPEEAHKSWMERYLSMSWVYGETYDPKAKTHPDLVPYEELGQLEQDKDAVYLALCAIARLYIYDEVVTHSPKS